MDNKALFSSILRQDLASFTSKVFDYLTPGTKFHHSWYIDCICQHLTSILPRFGTLDFISNSQLASACIDNANDAGRHEQTKGQFYKTQQHSTAGGRLIINIPPRHLKSIIVSVAWPAWLLGKWPNKKIIVASYCQNLSTKHSLDCRNVMQSSWYQQTFTKTRICRGQNTKNKYVTSEFGFRLATSIGAYVTGEGGDILIVDDPHNPASIEHQKIRNKAINWFENTFLTRLNDQQNGSVVVVMQRLLFQNSVIMLVRDQ